MLHDLNENQLLLAELMSDISESGFDAGWMGDLEFSLWEILTRENKKYGRHIVTQEELAQLKFLSEKYDCWIVFDDTHEETAVSLETWKRMYAERKRSDPKIFY